MARFKVLTIRVDKALTRSGLPDLDYALNPYLGCLHGCIYCYARLYTWHREASSEWGDVVVVKENLIEVLEREVKRIKPGVVGVSTITDPYQPVEAQYMLTRRSIELLLKHGFHVSIQTKNTLVLRDLDLLEEFKDQVDVGFTITSLKHSIARLIEPYSSPPLKRVEALKKISRQGIETWIFYGPVIPGLNDDEETVDDILESALEIGAKVLIDKLHVKKFMYRSDHPLHGVVESIDKWSWRVFIERVKRKCREYGVECIIGLAEPVKKEIGLDRFMI